MTGLGKIRLGSYHPVQSAIHSLDSRIKIFLTMVWAVATLSVDNFFAFALLAIVLAALLLLGRIPVFLLLRNLRPLFYILLMTLLIHAFFTAGTSLVAIGPLAVSNEGLLSGLFVTVRLVLLIAGTSLLTLTTTPFQLTDGLEWLMRPLRSVKVPTTDIAMMMGIAMRSIPLLFGEADKIFKAQMARGADFVTGNILRRARKLIPLLIPLFIAVFRHAGDLADAMESRCYQRGKPRGRLREAQTTPRDWIVLTITSIALVIIMIVGRRGGGILS